MNKNDVLHLAEVSKIELTEEEADVFEKEINEFLKAISFEEKKLYFENNEKTLNYSDLREDSIINLEKIEDILKNAEKTKENGFLVPKVI